MLLPQGPPDITKYRKPWIFSRLSVMVAPYPCGIMHPDGKAPAQTTYPPLNLGALRGSYATFAKPSAPIVDRVALTKAKGNLSGFNKGS